MPLLQWGAEILYFYIYKCGWKLTTWDTTGASAADCDWPVYATERVIFIF